MTSHQFRALVLARLARQSRSSEPRLGGGEIFAAVEVGEGVVPFAGREEDASRAEARHHAARARFALREFGGDLAGRAFAPQREHRLDAARALGDRDRGAARDNRRREPGRQVERQERRVARRGREQRKSPLPRQGQAGADAAERPVEARSPLVGDDGAAEALETRGVAVGVDEEFGDLRA